jgi:coenzyme PQQ precursor peptide PqqA
VRHFKRHRGGIGERLVEGVKQLGDLGKALTCAEQAQDLHFPRPGVGARGAVLAFAFGARFPGAVRCTRKAHRIPSFTEALTQQIGHSRLRELPRTLVFTIIATLALNCITRTGRMMMAWTTPTLVEICIGLEINGYLPAEF